MGQQNERATEQIFALANKDAEPAREWLAEAFTTQRRRGSARALTAEQQLSIGEVLNLDW